MKRSITVKGLRTALEARQVAPGFINSIVTMATQPSGGNLKRRRINLRKATEGLRGCDATKDHVSDILNEACRVAASASVAEVELVPVVAI